MMQYKENVTGKLIGDSADDLQWHLKVISATLALDHHHIIYHFNKIFTEVVLLSMLN